MLENTIETYFKNKVIKLGGLCFKLSTPGTTGIPDRIVILPKGLIWFVELKQPKGKLESIQKYIIKKLIQKGCNATVLNNKKEVDEWILNLTTTSNK